FANNPAAAASIMRELINGRLVSAMRGEVRDIDESSFRQGVVSTRFYGELWVPEELRYLQQVKSGGKEIEALAVQEIAADVVEAMDPGDIYFIGSGSTTAAINEALGLENTLLGVDVVKDHALLLLDATESELLEFARQGPCHIIVTAIGGQGHIFGRGNQQLSAEVIRTVGLANITVIATKSKLEALEGKPLLVDTGDAALDKLLTGTIRVVTGYEDAVLYPVAG
ncbi:MAG: ATP-NAD kinase, partial [Pseudomonadales bacterium]